MDKPPPPRVESEAELKDLQRVFAEIIRRPLEKDERMSPDKRTDQFIEANDRLTSHERLELYARQYWWRLIGSLSDDFKTVKKILGNDKFRECVEHFLVAHPSTTFTLRNLGRRFPPFLRDYVHSSTLLYEIARVEWAEIEVFQAAVPKPLSLESDDKSPEDLAFSIQPTLRLLALTYPVQEIIAPRETQLPTEELSNTVTDRETREEGTPLMLPEPRESYLAVHRFQSGVYLKELSRAEYTLLHSLEAGDSLESACEAAVNVTDDRENFDLEPLFTEWVSLGWLASR